MRASYTVHETIGKCGDVTAEHYIIMDNMAPLFTEGDGIRLLVQDLVINPVGMCFGSLQSTLKTKRKIPENPFKDERNMRGDKAVRQIVFDNDRWKVLRAKGKAWKIKLQRMSMRVQQIA